MCCINYYIALHANREDGCTGRFWEGRFISQALVDEAALLSCMVYVDLNPVRPGIATGLEDSDFTSIQLRIQQISATAEEEAPALMPFAESETSSMPSATLPYSLKGYLELVDWSGRVIWTDKKEYIGASTPKLLESLKLSSDQWRLFAKEIQIESVTTLHGLDKLSRVGSRKSVQKAP